MKTIYISLILITTVLSSCIKNDTRIATIPISKITFKTEFDDTYRADQWEEFTLECPEIIQENQDKPLSYKWEVNYKTVSTEKDLKFICKELTPSDMSAFPCRLEVSNEDGKAFMEFNLLVTSPYQVGLLVMSKTNEGTMLSFKREDKRHAEFQTDAYKINNPEFPLGNNPVAVRQVKNHLYIATADPIRYVKVEAQNMEAVYMFSDYPSETFDGMDGPVNRGGRTLYCYSDGEVIEMDGFQESFMNFFQQAFRTMYPGDKIAPKALICDYKIYFYNNTSGGLHNENAKPICEKAEWKNKKLIDCVNCNHNSEGLIIVQEEGKAPDIIYIAPDEGIYHSTESTEGTGINEKSRFAARQDRAHLYYSVGNKIFIYDYMSGGNFPTQPTYTIGKEGDEIKSMIFSPDEKKFYVAYNTKEGGEMKGCVRSFMLVKPDEKTPNEDLKDWDLEWEKTAIGGEIVDMIYKEE